MAFGIEGDKSEENLEYMNAQEDERARQQAELDDQARQTMMRNAATASRGPQDVWREQTQADGASQDAWGAALARQRGDGMRQVMDAAVRDRMSIRSQAMEITNRNRQAAAQRDVMMGNVMNAMMQQAPDGEVSEDHLAWANRSLGLPQGIGFVSGSGVQKDGSYKFRMSFGRGPDGNPIIEEKVIPLQARYVKAIMSPGSFDQSDIDGIARAMLKQGYTTGEIANLDGIVRRSMGEFSGQAQSEIDSALPNESARRRMEAAQREKETRNGKGIIVAGGVGGKNVSRLFGRTGPTHSRISVFGADGNGGFTRRSYDGFTGEDSGEINEGTRAEGHVGKWKVLRNGPEGKTYENSKTGEKVNVKDGENLRDVLARSSASSNGKLSFEQRRQLQKDNNEAIADRQDKQIKSRQDSESAKRTDLLKRLRERRIIEDRKSVESRRKSLEGMKTKVGSIEKPKYTKDEVSAIVEKMEERLRKAREADFGPDTDYNDASGAAEGAAAGDDTSQATGQKEDNVERWGSLTPSQIEKVKSKGGKYDEKTGEIVLPNGKRMKV